MWISQPRRSGSVMMLLLLSFLSIATPSLAHVAERPRTDTTVRHDRRENLSPIYGSTGGPEVWDVLGITDDGWVEAPTVATVISNRAALLNIQQQMGNGSIMTTLTDVNGSAHTVLYNRPPQPSADAVAWFTALKVAIGSLVIRGPMNFLNGATGVSQATRLLNAINGRPGFASVAPCDLMNSTTNLYALAQRSPVLASLSDGRLVALHTTAPPGYAPLSAIETNSVPPGIRFAVMFANFHQGGPNTMEMLESGPWFSQCKRLLYLPRTQ